MGPIEGPQCREGGGVGWGKNLGFCYDKINNFQF